MLEYNDAGKGFPLILIHGFCEDRGIWKYAEPFLSKHFRVIALDLPGFGESRLDETEVTIDFFAEKVKSLLDSLHIEKCVMVGHSLGGYVTLAFAEKFEKYLAGIGLFHSTAFEDSEEKKENRLKTVEFIQRHGVKLFAESFVPPLFSSSNREKLRNEIEEITYVAANTSELTVIQTTLAMRNRKDYVEVLKQLEVPVLYVVGKLDGAVPLEKSLEQCHLPKHSIVHFLETSGHMGMIENKEEAQKIVLSFMQYCAS